MKTHNKHPAPRVRGTCDRHIYEKECLEKMLIGANLRNASLNERLSKQNRTFKQEVKLVAALSVLIGFFLGFAGAKYHSEIQHKAIELHSK